MRAGHGLVSSGAGRMTKRLPMGMGLRDAWYLAAQSSGSSTDQVISTEPVKFRTPSSTDGSRAGK